VAAVTKGRNLLRIVVLVWLALSLRTGFVAWDDYENAVVQGPITPTNPAGLSTASVKFACAAPMRSGKPPAQADRQVIFTPPNPAPCSLRSQRQALFWVDIGFAVVALAATFAHLPRRWASARRVAVAA
jgi:hypothetical protein